MGVISKTSHGRGGFLATASLPLLAILIALLVALGTSGCSRAGSQAASADAASGTAPKTEEEPESYAPAAPLPYDVHFIVLADDGSVRSSVDGTKAGKTEGEAGGNGTPHGRVAVDVPGNNGGPETTVATTAQKPAPSDSAYLAGLLKKVCQLEAMRDVAPDGVLGLEMRARADIKNAVKLMESEGFFDGVADFTIKNAETGRADVTLSIKPGIRYTMGDATILYTPAPRVPESLRPVADKLFPAKVIPGIEPGSYVTATTMLSSVDRMTAAMHESGYPDAKLEEQHYFLDRGKHTLNAVVIIVPGEPATLGRVVLEGESDVDVEYLARLAPWEPGREDWDSRKVDDYISTLRRTGLFRNVTSVMAPSSSSGADLGQKPVVVRVEDAKHRTVSASMRYDTDTGIGVEGTWEHRNLFHKGEKLTITAPISTTVMGIKENFVKPEFLARNQSLFIKSSALSETTTAYDRDGIKANIGVERALTPQWFVSGAGLLDVGNMKGNSKPRQDYAVYGATFGIRYDTRNDPMNPTSGINAELEVTPYTGEYNGDFNVLSSKFGVGGVWAPFTKDGKPDDKLVFAGRAEVASMTGASRRNLPPNYLYYLGGAGSVRGYGYQQIGPMDKKNEPNGARSYQLVNLETRFKVTDDLGLVAFLDGGAAYTDEMPKMDLEMDWGTGLGVRYFTPIGPLRFDVAVPLKADTDPPVQFYISIGQAF